MNTFSVMCWQINSLSLSNVTLEVALELVAEDRFVDIVAERFDAGIRLGADVAKDMIALRISPDVKMTAAASPNYLAQHGTPKTPFDLTEHHCLKHRLATLGGILAWEFRSHHQENR